jgi:O-antigen/teichoic acid export membrane protein
MADGIGQVNFFTSIITYITLFTSLGIPLYAVRETARVRDNQELLNRTTLEILSLHTLLTFLGYLVVFILCLTVAKIQADVPLFLVLSCSIFFTTIGVEWFYQGIENFQYITIRGLIIRILAIFYLFLFVKTRDDLMLYAIYTVIGTVGNNVFNFIHLRKFISFRKDVIRELHPLKHLKPALRIFVLNLIISIYVNLDTVMLGFFKDNASVGFYTGSTKLTKLSLGIITSLGTVMLPRLSNLLQTGQREEFNKLAQKSVDFVMTFSVPVFVGLLILAPILIDVFCGNGYRPAIVTLQIISPIIVIIALSNSFGIQILYPQGKEKLVIISTAAGASVNFIINLLLIPIFSQNGAAIATVIAETVVTTTMFIIARNYLPIRLFTTMHLKTILAALIMGCTCYGLLQLDLNEIIRLLVIPVAGLLVYSLLLICMKNPFVDIVKSILIKKK